LRLLSEIFPQVAGVLDTLVDSAFLVDINMEKSQHTGHRTSMLIPLLCIEAASTQAVLVKRSRFQVIKLRAAKSSSRSIDLQR
jgi:hypothetical protein